MEEESTTRIFNVSFLDSSTLKDVCLLEKKESLKIYTSFPWGTGYKLGWTEEQDERGKIKSNFVYKLIEQSKKDNATYTKSEVKLEIIKKSNILDLDIKKSDKYGRKTHLATLSALALATEYYTKVDNRPEVVEECKYCLRVIEYDNTVYITENLYHFVHVEMDARKAVKAFIAS